MKIVLTGASGFVGRDLVPRLLDAGVEVVVCGRDAAGLRRLFPSVTTCDYDSLEEAARGSDLLFHLAARNNDCSGSAAEFDLVNVDFALRVLATARAAGIPRFVYVSSFHALNSLNTTAYAASKRRGAEALLSAARPGELCVLYVPAIHGARLAGRLSALNTLPRPLRNVALVILSAFRPTLSMDRLARFLLDQAAASAQERVLLSDGQTHNPVYRFVMRGIDIGFALTVLAGFWWALALIWLAVRLDSPGPGLFWQERIGRDGRPFPCCKFRTMQSGTRQAGTHEISASAVTRVGGFLRRTKLDELPQVLNILRGEIALIGPRPCLPVQEALIAARARNGVFALMPGISGLAQVEGIDMSDPERLAARDADYAAMQSILLDLRLVLATATGKGGGDRIRSQARREGPSAARVDMDSGDG